MLKSEPSSSVSLALPGFGRLEPVTNLAFSASVVIVSPPTNPNGSLYFSKSALSKGKAYKTPLDILAIAVMRFPTVRTVTLDAGLTRFHPALKVLVKAGVAQKVPTVPCDAVLESFKLTRAGLGLLALKNTIDPLP